MVRMMFQNNRGGFGGAHLGKFINFTKYGHWLKIHTLDKFFGV